MSSGVLLGFSLLWIRMPYFTKLSCSDNLRNLVIEGLMVSRIQDVQTSLSSRKNVLRRVVFALWQIAFEGTEGFLAVGGNPVHDDDHWGVFW